MNTPVKLRSILLVDDDVATNFLHKLMVDESGCTDHVFIATNGKLAIEYVIDAIAGKHLKPSVIFLDINMPIADGWDFLDDFGKLDEQERSEIKIIMLTSSINPDDEDRARAYPYVTDFRQKPLSVEVLRDVVNTHFSSSNS